jgi:hypothetical protein
MKHWRWFLVGIPFMAGVWLSVLWAAWSLLHGSFGPPVLVVGGAAAVRLLPTPWDWVARVVLHIYH